jgi:hypothetical protein
MRTTQFLLSLGSYFYLIIYSLTFETRFYPAQQNTIFTLRRLLAAAWQILNLVEQPAVTGEFLWMKLRKTLKQKRKVTLK